MFETRKSVFLHRRKLHPSLPKIKSETSSTSTTSDSVIKGEPFKPSAGDLIPKTERVGIIKRICWYHNFYPIIQHIFIVVYILYLICFRILVRRFNAKC